MKIQWERIDKIVVFLGFLWVISVILGKKTTPQITQPILIAGGFTVLLYYVISIVLRTKGRRKK